MCAILDRIVSCASCDCCILDLLPDSLDWDFDFASRSRTAPVASVLCCTTGVHLFVSESNLGHLERFVSGLWDLSLRRHAIVNNLVDELRLGKIQLFSASFVRIHVGAASSLRQSLPKSTAAHTHIDDLFVDSLWRELRLRTTVTAGVINVAQRITRIPFLCAL